jgi:hypothetical protein
MKNGALFLSAGLLLVSTLAVAGEIETARLYGEELSEGLELTTIEQILEDPDHWVGQRVRIAGEVSGVSSKRGCWMDLTSAEDLTLRVKVDDGVIVFPPEAVGQLAEAEGEVEILDMDREKYEAWLRHVAEEEAREFDPAEVGDAPYRIVRLRGYGAEISRR